jgi:hypothetical protein
MEEVLEHVKRLQSHTGVIGVLMATAEGAIVYTTLKEDEAIRYATFARNLVDTTTSELHALHPNNTSGDLALMRIRTIKHEVMIAREREFLLVAVQNPLAH